MSNSFNLTLDTLGPASPAIQIANGATYTSNVLVNTTLATTDTTTTGYQMKFWGDVDLAWAKTNGVMDSGATTTAESDATWVTYSTTKQIQLTSGDGSKTLYFKIRDDVYNESSQVSSSISLDTTLPVVTISGPDVPKISKKNGKNVCSFSFQSDSPFVEYKVKVVASAGGAQDTGTTIGTTNGSTNMAATGAFSSNTAINCQINGADLEVASAGDGMKIVKVFVKKASGQWSA